MADNSAAAATTAPKAEGSSQGQEQEKPQAQNETGRQQTEDGARGSEGTNGFQQQQQTEKEPPSPPLPPRPLPLPPQGSRKSQPPLPIPMPQQGVHFGPLPIEEDGPDVPYERPFSPRWQKASLVMGAMSLVTSAIILGVGIALGYLNAPYYSYWDLFSLADLQFCLSASAAGLAIVVVALDFVVACMSSRHMGMHPGALVAFHLIIWLLALVAVIFTALFIGYNTYDEYDYSTSEASWDIESKSYVYQQVLLAFDAILLGLHFILFIGACVETNKTNHAKKKVVIVRVPVAAGAPYPGAQYPMYGSPAPLPSQPAAAYGGYYAPAPQDLGMGWQQVNSPQWQGYYAAGAVPANAARHSWQQQPPAPALASSSGSRRSQRLSQTQAQAQAQASPTEAAPERTA